MQELSKDVANYQSRDEISLPEISDIHTRLYIENACKVFDCFLNINAVGLIFKI